MDLAKRGTQAISGKQNLTYHILCSRIGQKSRESSGRRPGPQKYFCGPFHDIVALGFGPIVDNDSGALHHAL